MPDTDPVPYADPPPGTRIRALHFPSDPPSPKPAEPVQKTRASDGTSCQLWATLGLPEPAGDPEGMGGRWEPYP